MNTHQKSAARNLPMECCKMIAAVMVVFIHAQFPGAFGSLLIALSRFAVPMFFAISGYFNYQAEPGRILRRMWHIVKLNVGAVILYAVWTACTAGLDSVSGMVSFLMPDAASLMRWMVLHASPYALAEPMWFMTSLIICYGALWCYTTFQKEETVDYKALYQAAFTLFTIYFALVVVLPMVDVVIMERGYRNGWFLGIPMFTMGIFIREYQDRIWERFHLTTTKLWGVLLAGVLLTLLQWKGEMNSEMPIGTLLSVTALIILVGRGTAPGWLSHGVAAKAASRLGVVSTAVYILHPLLVDVYDRYISGAVTDAVGGGEPWIRPLIVLGLSLTAAVIWERIDNLHARSQARRK